MSGQNRIKIGHKNNVDGSMGDRRRQVNLQVHATTRSVSKLTHQLNNNSLLPTEQDIRGEGIGSGKNGSSRSKRKLNSILNEHQHNGSQGDIEEDFNDNEDDLYMDTNGCNDHGPTQEEDQNLDLHVQPSNDTGGNKRKIAKKFVDRVEIALKTHETKKNNGVKPDADVIWLAEHTRTNDQGVLEWVNDARSKELHDLSTHIPPRSPPFFVQSCSLLCLQKGSQPTDIFCSFFFSCSFLLHSLLLLDVYHYQAINRSNTEKVTIFPSRSLLCVHEEKLHQLVQDKDKDKEGAPQTQEEMLLEVFGPKSGYTRGKGSGYGGSIKSMIQEEQQQKIIKRQKKLDEYEIELSEHKGQISNLVDSLKESQKSIAIIQKQMMEMNRLMALNSSRRTVEDDVYEENEDEEEY